MPLARRRNRRRRSGWKGNGGWVLARATIEVVAIGAVALILVVGGFGRVADRFHGTGLWSHLLPFALAVIAIGLAAAVMLWGWVLLRRRLARFAAPLPVSVACAAAVLALIVAHRPEYQSGVGNINALIGGSEEAERLTLAHQVYAAYRRANVKDLRRTLERGAVYEPSVREAAGAFGVDVEVLMGIGMAESAFNPRDSSDGGHGLFQITAPPRAAETAARQQLGVDALDPVNQRHNAFVAAATLKEYFTQMGGDLFLTLLAYNIGPTNGGLLAIMKQYGARDFVTVQPYLQQLPRDYPIRVLSGALAYRLWRSEHGLLRYEDGDNAQTIQRVGIPGMEGADGPRLVEAVAHAPTPLPVKKADKPRAARARRARR